MLVITEELKQEFEALNSGYIHEHGYSDADLKSYAKIKEEYNKRENKRNNNMCIDGDVLEIHSNNGHVFYKNAHIESVSYNETGFVYCEQPYIPFYNGLECKESVSGGAFSSFNPNETVYIGKTDKYIKVWGRYGACGNGALTVKVQTNRYKLILDKKFIPLCVERWADSYSDYKYNVRVCHKRKSNREQIGCFRTKAGLKEFLYNTGLRISHNKIGVWGNVHEIIGDVDFQALMSLKEYKNLKGDRKEFALLSNGEYTGAFLKDNIVYYCNPNVKDRTIYPYVYK